MYGTLDHVGLLVRDFDAAVAEAQEVLGLPFVRSAPLPQYSVEAAFLGDGPTTLEVFTFTDPEVLEPRLAGADRRLDHVAFRVDDLDALVATLRLAGVRFVTPDRRVELDAPLEIPGRRMLWTTPETAAGVALQLIELAP